LEVIHPTTVAVGTELIVADHGRITPGMGQIRVHAVEGFLQRNIRQTEALDNNSFISCRSAF
jgi:hypothetical protein